MMTVFIVSSAALLGIIAYLLVLDSRMRSLGRIPNEE